MLKELVIFSALALRVQCQQKPNVYFGQKDTAVANAPKPGTSCDLRGLWYNKHGTELFINMIDAHNFEGEFRTGVETRQKRKLALGELTGKIYGSVMGRAFSFHVVWPNRRSMTASVGQCHTMCEVNGHKSKGVTLHTAWLLSAETATCGEHWKSTRFGQDVYTRNTTIDKNWPFLIYKK